MQNCIFDVCCQKIITTVQKYTMPNYSVVHSCPDASYTETRTLELFSARSKSSFFYLFQFSVVRVIEVV